MTTTNSETAIADSQSPAKLPPHSLNEWLDRCGIKDWPAVDSSQLILEPGCVIGTRSDIEDDLRQHSIWDTAALDILAQRLSSLEQNVEIYGARFLYDNETKESAAGGLRVTSDEAGLLADLELLHSRVMQMQVKKGSEENSRCAEAAVFPGFSDGHSPAMLPGKLEALSLLDLVTKCQGFPAYLMKSWRKFFYSELSCSILQNTFWWVWSSYFKPDQAVQSQLFTRISDSFTMLISKMSPQHQDTVFWHYSKCLAQALYATFCRAFPDSVDTFNSASFLTHISEITSEWIAGVKCQPEGWKRWPLKQLNPLHSHHSEPKAEKLSFTEKDLLRSAKVQFKPLGEAVTGQLQRSDDGSESSHMLGPGTIYERVQFSTLGKSPLLQYYLDIHELTEGSLGGHIVKRTEVKDIPAHSVSYDVQLQQSAEHASSMYEDYNRQMAMFSQVFRDAHKEHIASLRAMQREHKSLLLHRRRVSILAEKLMNKQKVLRPLSSKATSKLPDPGSGDSLK
ncbi:hypothetical protein EMCRGX_G022089 [Ephydatia muelleri]